MSKITIIIPAYNCCKTILQTIEAVKKQEGLIEPPEIIIVDDGSNDKTLEVLNQIKDIKVLSQHNSGPASARNNGAKASTGDILVFTDSDTVPHKDWLKNLTEPFENPDIVATTGTYSIENCESKLASLIQYEIENKHSKYNDYVAFGGSYNLAIRRDLFFSIGGFNEEYKSASSEDVDISYKILNRGYKIKFVKSAIVGHFHPESLIKYLKTQFKHGFWRAKLYYDHPNKLTGDDYTGYKETFETVFSSLTIISPLLIFANFIIKYLSNHKCEKIKDSQQNLHLFKLIFKYFPLVTIILLFCVEFCFVSKLYNNIIKNKTDLPSRHYAVLIFSLRAVYRTLGFIKGLAHFI